jgi:hypothetical protein
MVALPEPEREGPGQPGPAGFPARMLVVRGERGFEYQLTVGTDPQPGTAQYRLTAMRTRDGEAVTFSYGANGVDFEAASDSERVRVTLGEASAAAPVPDLDDTLSILHPQASALAFRDLEARLQVTYAGPEALPGYVITALVRPIPLPAERTPSSAWLRSLQVARVEGAAAERVEFGYGKAPAVIHAGLTLAPTVLQDIVLSGRILQLDWEVQSGAWREPSGSGESPRATWLYGVAGVQDRDTDPAGSQAQRPPYRRAEQAWKAPALGQAWVRQSRHFALGCAPEGTSCQTHVRDRWELRPGGAAWTGASARRLAYDSEGDIPTLELEPQTGTLVPVPGQLTRWLNWEAGAADPPDPHGDRGPSESGRMRLLGGMFGLNPTLTQMFEQNRKMNEDIQRRQREAQAADARRMEENQRRIRETQEQLNRTFARQAELQEAQRRAHVEQMSIDTERAKQQAHQRAEEVFRAKEIRCQEEKADADAQKAAEVRAMAEEYKRRAAEDARKAAQDHQRAAEAIRKAAEEERKATEAKRKAVEEERKAVEEERKAAADAKRRVAEAEARVRKAAEGERKAIKASERARLAKQKAIEAEKKAREAIEAALLQIEEANR